MTKDIRFDRPIGEVSEVLPILSIVAGILRILKTPAKPDGSPWPVANDLSLCTTQSAEKATFGAVEVTPRIAGVFWHSFSSL